MEQKQLDEIEESFSGEELIDDLNEDVIIEEAKPKRGRKKKKEAKATAKKEVLEENKVVEENKMADTPKEEIKIEDNLYEEAKVEDNPLEEPKEIKTDNSTEVKTNEPIKDPWDDDEEEGGMFKEASTWKAITGIILILLIISVFTEGFSFVDNGGNQVTGNVAALSLSEAEEKALDYVNNNLLRPPFLAEVVASEEVNNLYKVTLSVAGQDVDSYITKDGSLFFPQGFDTNEVIAEEGVVEEIELEEVVGEEVVAGTEEIIEEVGEETEGEVPVDEEPTEVEVEAPVVEEPIVEANPTEFSLVAKRWLFSPNKITVSKGETITFTIEPDNLDFTFAIPDLGVE